MLKNRHSTPSAALLIIAVILLHYRRRRARALRTAHKTEELTALALVKAPPPTSPSSEHSFEAHPSAASPVAPHAVAHEVAQERSETSTSLDPLPHDHQDIVMYQKQLEMHTRKQAGEVREAAAPPPYQEQPAVA